MIKMRICICLRDYPTQKFNPLRGKAQLVVNRYKIRYPTDMGSLNTSDTRWPNKTE